MALRQFADRIKIRFRAPVEGDLLHVPGYRTSFKFSIPGAFPACYACSDMSHGAKTPKDVLEYAKKNEAKQLDLRFTDLPGLQHHVSYPISELEEDTFEAGLRHGRIEHPRLGRDQRKRHAADPRSDHRLHRSVLRNPHAGDDLRRHRSDHAPALRSRPALDRAEGRDVSARTPASPTPLISARKPNFSFSTTSVSIRTRTPVSISSTPKRAAGIPAARTTTSATGRAIKKAISRSRPPIIIRTCAPKWSRP